MNKLMPNEEEVNPNFIKNPKFFTHRKFLI